MSRLERNYFTHFKPQDRSFALQLLELGRSSYLMCDDDNVYLAGIESELDRAVEEVRLRLKGAKGSGSDHKDLRLVLNDRSLQEIGSVHNVSKKDPGDQGGLLILPKQMRGQPASQGIAYGRAHV